MKLFIVILKESYRLQGYMVYRNSSFFYYITVGYRTLDLFYSLNDRIYHLITKNCKWWRLSSFGYNVTRDDPTSQHLFIFYRGWDSGDSQNIFVFPCVSTLQLFVGFYHILFMVGTSDLLRHSFLNGRDVGLSNFYLLY